jgi:hypothetical protein
MRKAYCIPPHPNDNYTHFRTKILIGEAKLYSRTNPIKADCNAFPSNAHVCALVDYNNQAASPIEVDRANIPMT